MTAQHRKPPRIAFYRPWSQIATMTILMTAGVFVALADGMPRELYIAPRLAAATSAVPGQPVSTRSWLIIVVTGFLFAAILATLTWWFFHETNPGRHAAKPLPDPDPDDWDDSEDGVADWARSIASPLRKRLISPLVTARTELTAFLLIAQRVRAGLPADDLVQPERVPDARPDGLALTAISPAILARVRTGLAALPDNARAGNWTPRPELPAAPADTEPATSWDLKAIDNGTPAAAAAPPDDWRAHLDWCLTAPVDQVKALSW